MINNHEERRKVTTRGVYVLAALVLGAMPLAAQACISNPNNSVGFKSLNLTGSLVAGDVISDWTRGSAMYLWECPVGQTVDVSLSQSLTYAGTIGGRETFATSNGNIGVQFEYQYANGFNANGTVRMSSWIPLTRGTHDITLHGDSAAAIVNSAIGIYYDMRFVALNDISGDQEVKDVQPVDLQVKSHGFSVNQFVWEGVYLTAPRAPSCVFSGGVGRTIDVPTAYTSQLKDEGDMGRAQRFSWSWSCDPGAGTEYNDRGDFRYRSTTTVTEEKGGRMRVTGGATGVDILVTRRNGSGDQEPIHFNRWYGDFFNVPLSGSEDMEVRYIRNKDALNVGEANAGLIIDIEPR